jgi:hypothetical protein
MQATAAAELITLAIICISLVLASVIAVSGYRYANADHPSNHAVASSQKRTSQGDDSPSKRG